MRGQNVVAAVCQSWEGQEVEFPVWYYEQRLLRFEFLNSTQEVIEKPLREWQVRLLLQNLRTVLRRLSLQYFLRRQRVSVDGLMGHCERIGMRGVQDILEEKFRRTEIILQSAKIDGFRRGVACRGTCVELLFRFIDRVEDVASGGRVVGIEQCKVQLRQVLLRSVRFVWCDDFVMRQRLCFHSAARTLDHAERIRGSTLIA
jgi:hypothetical protein